MLEQAFEVAVIISAIDRFTAPARMMAQQMGLVGKQAEALQQKLAGFKNMALVGGAMTLAGAGMAKGLLSAADAAGNLQMSLTGVKTALKLNNDEYQKAMNLAQTVGIPTGFKAQDVGNIMQAMATSGLTKQQVMDPSILKEYVNFADVQSALKHENGPDVAAAAVKMAHQYQLYSSNQIAPFLNELNGALTHSNQSASEFQTSYRYIAPVARTMGMSAADTLTTTAWMDRMGMGAGRGGGGTAMADFLRRSIYGSSGKAADSAMVAAGFVKNGRSVFEDAKGAFVGMPAAIKIMQDFGKRFHGDAAQMLPLLTKIFGTVGEKVAIGMTSSGASEQYTRVQQQIQQSPTVNASQLELSKNWARQMQQLGSSLNDIWTNFGKGVTTALLPFLKSLNNILAKIVLWTQAHPQVMKWIATFASIATAVMLVVGPMLLLTGVIGYLSTANMFTAGFKMLGSAIGGALGPITLLISAGYLLYQAWQTDFGGIREKTKSAFDWIKKEAPIAIAEIQKLAKSLGLENAKGQFQIPTWLKVLMGGMVGGKAFSFLGGGALKILGPLAKMFKAGGVGRALGGDLVEGMLRVLTGEKFGSMSGVLRGGLKKALTGGLKGLEGIGKALFGKQTIDVVKWLGLKGFKLTKLIGKGGFNLAKLLGKGGFNLAKLLGKGAATGIKLLGQGAKLAAQFGGSLLKLAAQALIAGARMAVAWVIGLGPIAWIIAAVIAIIGILWLAWKTNFGHIQEHVKAWVEMIKSYWTFLKLEAVKVFVEMFEWIRDKWDGIISWFESLPDKFKQFGSNIVHGLWNGIISLASWLKDKVLGWVKDVLPGPVAKALGINSPSKLMQEYGKYTAQGLALGMTDNANLVKLAAKQLSVQATPTIGTGSASGYGSAQSGAGMIYIAPGAVVVNAAPGQSPDDIAKATLKHLGRKIRNQSYGRPTRVISAW